MQATAVTLQQDAPMSHIMSKMMPLSPHENVGQWSHARKGTTSYSDKRPR
jgi:hypothetical protein